MSLPTAFNVINEQNGVLVEHEFSTKDENLHVLYYIARNQLYSDEILALLREYGCNAMDIHIATGQSDRPILVSLPTVLDCFLKIRDFGTGLDEDGIMDFVSFGESSKRNDPLQTGQLGIGCKCGFTYGDSFIVNSYKDGILTSWNAYIDPSNKGKIAKMAESPTDEANGIEVVIPIQQTDIDKCVEKAMWFFSFSRITPEFKNISSSQLQTLTDRKNAKPLYSGEGWKYMGRGTSYAVMGNIPYPIKTDVFTTAEVNEDIRELLNGGIIIDCELGSLDFAASREQLKYTPATKSVLSEHLNLIIEDLYKLCSSSFSSCASLWEAKKLHKKIFDFGSSLYPLRSLFKSVLTYKNHRVDSNSFSTVLKGSKTGDLECRKYAIDNYGEDIKTVNVYDIPVNDNILIVENDINEYKGIKNRVVNPLHSGLYNAVYVLFFANAAIKTKWLDESGLDCPILPISKLVKEPLSKYFPKQAINQIKNLKHLSKEFVYNNRNSRYSGTRSNFWDAVDIDIETQKGVYVELEKFSYIDAHSNCHQHPHTLINILEALKHAGLELDVLYGFKKNSVDYVKNNNSDMVEFHTWMKQVLADYVEKYPEINQRVVNYFYRQNKRLPSQEEIEQFAKLPMVLDAGASHPLAKLLADLISIQDGNMNELRALIKLSHYCGYVFPEVSVKHNVMDSYEAIVARYPMITFPYCSDIKKVNDYIQLVDCVTPY